MAQVYGSLNQQAQAQHQATQSLQAQQFNAWAAQQDDLATKAIPEAANPKFKDLVPEMLTNDWGFQPHELAAAYTGKGSLSMRDARVQRLIADAMRWRVATKASKQIRAQPLPPVQRPGVSRPYAASERNDLRSVERRLSQDGSVKAATALLIARRS